MPTSSTRGDPDFHYKVSVDAIKLLDDHAPAGQRPDGTVSASLPSSSSVAAAASRLDCSRHAFQLRWFVTEEIKGASPFVFECARAGDGDEVTFDTCIEFRLASRSGVVAHLLQLSVIACAPVDARALERGDAFPGAPDREITILGVLMIDLNAHVPRPPAKLSSQKAMLYLSRSPLTPPPLMRIAIRGAPFAPAPPMIVSPKQQPPPALPGGGGGGSSVPRARSSPGGSAAAGESATIDMMMAADDGDAADAPDAADTPPPQDVEGLRAAFDTAKAQMRSLIEQNAQQRREIAVLQRRNRLQHDEGRQLRAQASEEGVARVRASYEGRVLALRDELASLTASNADMRALAQTAEVLAESLSRELESARAEAAEAAAVARELTEKVDELRTQNGRYERALKHGQDEIVKLHTYCAQAKSAFEDALVALQKERLENAHNKRRVEDLQRLLDVANMIRKKDNETVLPMR